MEIFGVGKYEFEELAAKAMAFGASQEDINKLGEWFSNYGADFWNGESYDIDGSHRLFPVYKETEEEEFEIVGYEVR